MLLLFACIGLRLQTGTLCISFIWDFGKVWIGFETNTMCFDLLYSSLFVCLYCWARIFFVLMHLLWWWLGFYSPHMVFPDDIPSHFILLIFEFSILHITPSKCPPLRFSRYIPSLLTSFLCVAQLANKFICRRWSVCCWTYFYWDIDFSCIVTLLPNFIGIYKVSHGEASMSLLLITLFHCDLNVLPINMRPRGSFSIHDIE